MTLKHSIGWTALALCSALSWGCSGKADADGSSDSGDADGSSDSSGDGSDGNASGGSSSSGNCEGGEKIPCTLDLLPTTGDPAQDCVNRVNQFREECLCLPPLERWADKEACSNTQSGDDAASGDAHSNFGDCGEWGQCTCPGWGGGTDAIIGGCLQMMWDEGPGEGPEHGHHNIMASTGYKKVACGFFTMENGDIWANQNYGN